MLPLTCKRLKGETNSSQIACEKLRCFTERLTFSRRKFGFGAHEPETLSADDLFFVESKSGQFGPS